MGKIAYFGFGLLVACSGGTTGSATAPASGAQTSASTPSDPVEAALTADDLAKTWVKLPGPGNVMSLARTATGFVVAVSTGSSKVVSPPTLHQSADGVSWQPVSLPPTPESGSPAANLAYGAGKVVLDYRGTWTSTDLVTWTPASVPPAPANPSETDHDVGRPVRAGGKFFGLQMSAVYESDDGTTWSRTPIDLVQGRGVSFGNGVWVVNAALSIRSSSDGVNWSDRSPACSVAGAKCVTTPDGAKTFPGSYDHSAFLDGRFYVDTLASMDGMTWAAHAEPLAPTDALGGYLFHVPTPSDGEVPISAWQPGQAPVPLHIEQTVPAGVTCQTNRCVVLEGAIYLLR